MLILIGCVVFVIACLCTWCVSVHLYHRRYRNACEQKIEELTSDNTALKEQVANLSVELAIRPPDVKNWVVGVTGLMDVLNISRYQADTFMTNGVRFPAPFSTVNGAAVWDKDEVLDWHRNVLPKTSHLLKGAR